MLLENSFERSTHQAVDGGDQNIGLRRMVLYHDATSVSRYPFDRSSVVVTSSTFTAPRGDFAADAFATYQDSASATPAPTSCVGENLNILRAFSIPAHEKRTSPGRNASYCGTASANDDSVRASSSRNRWKSSFSDTE